MKLRDAGSFEILLGSVNTLKQSARLFLQVIVGSKRMSLLLVMAMRLAAFRLGVSEKFPWSDGGLMGYILGSIRRMRNIASIAHK